jgi:hypothetical protein
MSSVLFFDAVPVSVPWSRIYRRLGYRKGITHLLPQQKEETDRYIEEAQGLLQFKAAALRLSVLERDDSGITLAGNIRFESRKLSSLLEPCREIVLMGATAGNDIMEAIREDAAGRHVTRGVVRDATASEMTDTVLDWVMAYFNRTLRRENKSLLSKRFSAGYGDFLLENQKIIYSLLQLDRIGVRMTESCILIPEKSVTAVSGIEALRNG